MSSQIDTALVASYKNNITLRYQQMGSRLKPYVRVEMQNAEFDYYDRIGATSAVQKTTRASDTPLIDTPHDRRRLAMVDFEWADLIDRPDKLRMLADPTSAYVENAAMALGRSVDDQIISAASGTAYSGKTGGTAVSFLAGQQIAVNYVESGAPSDSNLTVAKLRRVKYLLDKNEATKAGEMIVGVFTSSQQSSLLRDSTLTSHDYNTVKALVAGEVDTFMGIKFVRTERLSLAAATNIRTCLFWAQNAMLLAEAQEIKVRVDERSDKSYSTQVYACGTFGASRMEELGVIEVACDEDL